MLERVQKMFVQRLTSQAYFGSQDKVYTLKVKGISQEEAMKVGSGAHGASVRYEQQPGLLIIRTNEGPFYQQLAKQFKGKRVK